MTKLRLAPDLSLPLDAATQRFGEIGRIGSGKSYIATKLAELFFDAGIQFVAIDPVGIWYGLRVDGSGKALNIPIFGGLHGDVPLESTAGALMADLIVERRLSCVLDVSQFEHDTDKARFARDFAKRFYWLKKQKPSAVHLFLEECQEFIPQIPAKGEEQMLHEFARMAKLGRNFGIGMSLITQRPQEVSKKALTLTQPWATLVAIGAKSIETRGWSTSYRGPIAIHAAKKFPAEARALCPLPPFDGALGTEILHTGKIVALATIATCFRFNDATEEQILARSASGRLPAHEADFGDYAAGRFGFVLTDVRRVPNPIEARGMLSLWEVPADVAALVDAQFSELPVPA